MSETIKTEGSKFMYVTYIRTTPEKLWDALRLPEFTRQYWSGIEQESTWEAGSSWKMNKDGKTMDEGEVLEIDPPRRLVLKWGHVHTEALKAEGFSRATYVLEPLGETVKLTVTHEIPVPDSKLIVAVSGGWPAVLSGLKTFLETGQPLPPRPPAK